MKIFFSWSGPYSHSVAMALREWLKLPFPHVQTFVSSEDIRKGKRWLHEISKELTTTNFGIVCLTPENFEAPWIVFEAGALSKLKDSSVCTLLLRGLRSGNIEGPLSHFQHTTFNKTDVYKMLAAINEKSGKNKREESGLKTLFERLWPDLEKQVAELPAERKEEAQEKRSVEDMVYELLEITRSIARNVPAADEYQKLRQLLNMGVYEIELSDEAVAALEKLKIKTVGRLATTTVREVLRVTTARVCDELEEKLGALGLGLGMTFEKGLLDEDKGGGLSLY